MRIALLGGSGFIGPRVAQALRAHGHEPLTLSRGSGVDRFAPSTVVRALSGADVLIDFIARDIENTAPVLDALSGKIKRYVLISSADVYRNFGVLHRLESAPVIALLNEDAPLRTQLYPYSRDPPRAGDDPEAWMESYDKIPIERAVHARTDMETTILRLPMVYGPGDKQQRFRVFTSPMRKGLDIAAHRAWLDWVTTYGHVDNVAAAIALAATQPGGANATFNVGETPEPHRAWISRFAQATAWRGAVIEDENAPIAAMLASLDLTATLALDTSRIRALGYCDPLSPEDAIHTVLD